MFAVQSLGPTAGQRPSITVTYGVAESKEAISFRRTVVGPSSHPSAAWIGIRNIRRQQIEVHYEGMFGYSSLPIVEEGSMQICLPGLRRISTAIPLAVYTIRGIVGRGLRQVDLDDVVTYHKSHALSESDVTAFLEFMGSTKINIRGLHGAILEYYKGKTVLKSLDLLSGFDEMELASDFTLVGLRYVPRWFQE